MGTWAIETAERAPLKPERDRGRLSRIRHGADVLLARMLSDDAEEIMPGQGLAPEEGSPAEGSSGEDFWDAEDRGQEVGDTGYRSKHALAGPVNEPRQHEGRRSAPRHAAPPASAGASFSRLFLVFRLPGRYAAHAGW